MPRSWAAAQSSNAVALAPRGSESGRCLSVADYVRGPAAIRGAIAAGRGYCCLRSHPLARLLADRGEIRTDSHISTFPGRFPLGSQRGWPCEIALGCEWTEQC